MTEAKHERTVIVQPGEHIDIPLDQLQEIDYDPRFFKVETVLLPDEEDEDA